MLEGGVCLKRFLFFYILFFLFFVQVFPVQAEGFSYSSVVYNKEITLFERTYLFDSPNSSENSISFISPQTVLATHKDGEWIQIQTWLGLKWVKPSLYMEGVPVTVNQELTIHSRTDLYNYPLEGQSKITSIAPQTVHSRQKLGEWYKIQTWLGEKWIKPTDYDLVVKNLILSNSTELYDKNFITYKNGAKIAPQSVKVLGSFGEWKYIQTWLGPKWIIPLSNSVSSENNLIFSGNHIYLYEQPFSFMKSSFLINPQGITLNGKWTDDFGAVWFKINTWLGAMWVKSSDVTNIYQLELSRWNIYNDNSHPIETTKGFNDALQWANTNKASVFKVPSGTYLIKKDQPINSYTPDASARINMVSDITFELDANTVIQKEANDVQGYSTLYIGEGVHDVTIRGGTYKGDRYIHNYSSGGTHENGIGILTAGARNVVIENVKTTLFTGDGLCLCGGGRQIEVLNSSDFESGSIDDNGNLIADSSKIRTKNKGKTDFDHPYFQKTRTIHFSLAQNLPKDGPFDVYFYRGDGTFLSSVKNQEVDWHLIEAPLEASYFHLVYHDPNLTNIQLQYWNKPVTKNVVVRDSETSFNRRQGITVGGVDGASIYNNEIHDISGTAPESGIDVEGGVGGNGHPNLNISIKNNHFYNNKAFNVILYDGENASVEGNIFKNNNGVFNNGVTVSSPFRTGAMIKNNQFDGSNIIVGEDSTYLNNTIKNATVTLFGPRAMVDGMNLENSTLASRLTQPFGVDIQNLTFNNTDITKGSYTLSIYDNPVHLKNVTINGSLSLSTMFSNNVDGNIFENFKSYNHRGYDFAGGTYTNCIIESDAYAIGNVNDAGTYVFDSCTFKGSGPLQINNTNANVTIKNSIFNAVGDKELLVMDMANKVDILNNTFNANNLPFFYQSVVRLNSYFTKDNPFDVLESTIIGNTINSTHGITGLSTEYAGVGAPPYTIQNNTTVRAKFKLKSNDIQSGNIEN